MRAMAPDDQRDISAPPDEAKPRAVLGCAALTPRRWTRAVYRRLRTDPEFVFVIVFGGLLLSLFVVEEVLIARDVPSRVIAVDSVPPEESYPLAQWTLDKAASGYFEGATVAGARLTPSMAKSLGDAETISLHGWAGDTDLGTRFTRVVFSMCNRTIGGAVVDIPRPDVAQQVHPNLDVSGWTAQLLVGHLPRCDGARLAAWAVAPIGRTLYPLQGSIGLALPPANESVNGPAVAATTTKLVHPADVEDSARRIVVEIKTGTVNLRRCGAASCTVVGSLGRGRHSGIRLGDNDAWTLVVIPDVTSGWISREAARVVLKN